MKSEIIRSSSTDLVGGSWISQSSQAGSDGEWWISQFSQPASAHNPYFSLSSWIKNNSLLFWNLNFMVFHMMRRLTFPDPTPNGPDRAFSGHFTKISSNFNEINPQFGILSQGLLWKSLSFYRNQPEVQPSRFKEICKENLKFSRNRPAVLFFSQDCFRKDPWILIKSNHNPFHSLLLHEQQLYAQFEHQNMPKSKVIQYIIWSKL